MRWLRALLLLGVVLGAGVAHALIPSTAGYEFRASTTAPWITSAETACRNEIAIQNAATWANHYEYLRFVNLSTEVTCVSKVRNANGTTAFNEQAYPQLYRRSAQICPANSTAVTGGCQCAAGYQENAAKTACEVGASEAEKFCQSMIGHTINTGGTGSIPAASCHMPEPPFDAPEQAKGCGVTIGDAVKFPDDTGAIRWSGVGKFGGGTCTPGASPGLPPVESKDDKCPGGFAGTVNGEQKCIPAEPDKGIEGVKSSSSTDASGTKKDVKEETKCEGQKCTTTTTTTTTTSSGSTSTTTEKKEEAITDKCQKDPTNAVCQKTNGGMGGKVSDSSCAVNPSAKGCGGTGASIGDLYTGKGVTVQSILDQAVTDLKGSGIGGAVGGFFTVSGGGSCPPLVWNVSYVNATVSLPSLCSDTANTIYAVLQGVLLVVAGFVAFRVAIDN